MRRTLGALGLSSALITTAACGSSDSESKSNAGSGGVAGVGGAGAGGGVGGSGGAGGSASTGGAAGAAGSAAKAHTYGNVWSADSLQNWNIGSPKQQRWSYRFRAPLSGAVEHIRPFFVENPSNKTGYSEGSGGTVRVELCGDDGSSLHAPDCSSVMASTEVKFALVDGQKGPGQTNQNLNFQQLVLAPQPTLDAGTLYHLVFSNVDPNPEANWIGLDGLVEFGTSERPPGRPDLTDWGLLLGNGGTWTDWSNADGNLIETPVLSVALSGGASFGCGYMEVWPSSSQARSIDGKASVRERFSPAKNVTVTGLQLRVKRTSGGGTLVATLERADGTLIEQLSIDASKVDDARHAWVEAAFTTPHTLNQGAPYHLVLSAAQGGAFTAHCVRDGGSYDYESGSVFADGWAEFDRGDGLGWLGWYGWSTAGDPSYKDGDLQLYFSTSE